MNMNEIVNTIGSLGFPIVCCGALFWFIWKMLEKHDAESKEFAEAINRNSLVIERMTALLESEFSKDIKEED